MPHSAKHNDLTEAGADTSKPVPAPSIRQHDDKYRLLWETTTDVVVLIGADDRILYTNPAVKDTFGYEPAELVGQPVTDLQPVRMRQAHHDALNRFLDTGQRTVDWRARRTAGLHRDGHEFPVEISYSHMIIDGVPVFGGFIRDISEREHIADALRESERRFSTMLANIQLISLMLDREGSITYCNDYLLRLTGWRRDEVAGRNWFDLFIPPECTDVRALFDALLADEASAWHYENEITTRAGERRLIRWNNSVLRSPDGAVVGTASIGEDITERTRAAQRIARLNRVNTVLSGINAAILRIRDRDELLAEACRIAVDHGQFGIAWIGLIDPHSGRLMPAGCRGLDPDLLVQHCQAAPAPESRGTVGEALRSGRAAVCNDIGQEPQATALRRLALERGYRSIAALPLMRDNEAMGAMVLYAREPGHFDGTELTLLNEVAGDIAFGLQYLEKDEQLSHLAYYDALTGLPNAKLFDDRLDQFLSTARHKAATVGVILLDLDRFTQLNDTLGRHGGDTLLKTVAQRFREALREPYSLARIGSDTYAVAVPDLRSGADAVAIINERLFAALDTPIGVDGRDIRLTARAGIALFPGDGEDASTLFKNAEAALKHAQASGERYLYYSPQINARVAEKLALEAKLRGAMERNEFLVHYQPKVAADGSGGLAGLEALIAWQDPQTGHVPPTSFIPILEETRLILEVGYWVLQRALADYGRWQAAGFHPPRVAVNVSPVQLRQTDFVDKVRQAIEVSGVGPQALELEITESVIMDDIESNIRTLAAIRELGVTIAIDDFGTGYASFRYLAKLPVDTLKIDRSFVVTMTDDPNSMAIVSTMIALAHSMNCRVVAEGVDAEEQSRFLRLLRCDELQGFLFSQALPADEVTRWFT